MSSIASTGFHDVKRMNARILFSLFSVLLSQLAHAIPNPQIAQQERLRRAERESALILELKILGVDFAHSTKGGDELEVTARAELVGIVKGTPGRSVGEELTVRYFADYVAEEREWTAYLNRAKAGIVGELPPKPRLPRLRQADVVTGYLKRDSHDTILVTNHFELRESAPLARVTLGESISVGVGEWVRVDQADGSPVAEMRVEGLGRGACPDSSSHPIGAMCSDVRTEIFMKGRIYKQAHDGDRPTALQQGFAVQVRSSTPSQAEIRLIDESTWRELWPPTSKEYFSYGCGGGIAGAYSRLEIRHDGRVSESRRNHALGTRSIAIVAEDPKLAEKVSGLLETIDLKSAGKDPGPSSYGCEYELTIGDERSGSAAGCAADRPLQPVVRWLLDQSHSKPSTQHDNDQEEYSSPYPVGALASEAGE